MITVYRIEDKDHNGPYAHGGSYGYMRFADSRHPTAELEFWDGPKGVYFAEAGCLYGFKDQSQLSAWFDSWDLNDLTRNGYQVVTYQVDADYVEFGEHQIRFNTAGIVTLTNERTN